MSIEVHSLMSASSQARDPQWQPLAPLPVPREETLGAPAPRSARPERVHNSVIHPAGGPRNSNRTTLFARPHWVIEAFARTLAKFAQSHPTTLFLTAAERSTASCRQRIPLSEILTPDFTTDDEIT
jgi:hypothetical protein